LIVVFVERLFRRTVVLRAIADAKRVRKSESSSSVTVLTDTEERNALLSLMVSRFVKESRSTARQLVLAEVPGNR
jgi:hypothetical protein